MSLHRQGISIHDRYKRLFPVFLFSLRYFLTLTKLKLIFCPIYFSLLFLVFLYTRSMTLTSRTQNIAVMLFNWFHRLCHVPCFPMPMVILCFPAMLMVDHDGPIRTIQTFANDPAVLCVIGEKFNIPLRFPYDGKVSLSDLSFLFLRKHIFSFQTF